MQCGSTNPYQIHISNPEHKTPGHSRDQTRHANMKMKNMNVSQPMNLTTTMKTTLFTCALLFASLLSIHADESDGTASASPPAQVFLIDDPTGDELARDHGIQPIAVADLSILIEGVISEQRAVRIHHELIDEEASDNEVRGLTLEPYAGGAAPKKPSPNLPLRQLVEETNHYRSKRELWIRGILTYRAKLETDIDTYVRGLTDAQSTLSERFDELLLARQGRDFNRSDVGGAVLSAGRHLGAEGLRICVLNTDAEDLPGDKPARRSPYTSAELDPGIILIWVNTSGQPQQEPAFSDLPNPSHHVQSMAEAMTLIRGMLSDEGTETAPTEPSATAMKQ